MIANFAEKTKIARLFMSKEFFKISAKIEMEFKQFLLK